MKLCFIFCVCLFGIVVESALVSFEDKIMGFVPNEVAKAPSKTLTSGEENPKEITIKVAIHFDHQLIQNLTSEYKVMETKRRFMTKIADVLMKNIQEIYRDQNLGVKVNFRHSTRFLKKSAQFPESAVEQSHYLNTYCQWQANQKKSNGQIYFSVMLTGMQLIEEDDVQGAAYITNSYKSSMCNLDKSCTVQPWTPKNLEYNVAAAIGHSLGMTYDIPADCEEKQSIMNIHFKPNEDKGYWSECNGNALQEFLKSKEAKCIVQKEQGKKVAPAQEFLKNKIIL